MGEVYPAGDTRLGRDVVEDIAVRNFPQTRCGSNG
jgi:hypothetical protein